MPANFSLSTTIDAPATLAAPGVLAGASNPNGGDLVLVDYTQPTSGRVAIDAATGQVVFTPGAAFYGTVGCMFKLSNGRSQEGTGFLTFEVGIDPNHLLVPVNHTINATDRSNITLTGPGVLAGAAANPNGGTLTVVGYAQPPHGQLSIQADGALLFVPEEDVAESFSVQYNVTNGRGQYAVAWIEIRQGGRVWDWVAVFHRFDAVLLISCV